MGRAPKASQVCSGALTSEPCLKQLDPSCPWTLWDAFKFFFLPGKWPVKISGLGSHLLVVIKCSAAQPWQREGSLQLSPQLGLGWDGLGSISTRQKKSQIIKTTQPLMIFFYAIWLLFQQNTGRTLFPRVPGEQTDTNA